MCKYIWHKDLLIHFSCRSVNEWNIDCANFQSGNRGSLVFIFLDVGRHNMKTFGDHDECNFLNVVKNISIWYQVINVICQFIENHSPNITIDIQWYFYVGHLDSTSLYSIVILHLTVTKHLLFCTKILQVLSHTGLLYYTYMRLKPFISAGHVVCQPQLWRNTVLWATRCHYCCIWSSKCSVFFGTYKINPNLHKMLVGPPG